MPKTFQFPVWLQGSPQQQQAEAERQALAMASHTRAHLSEAERLVGRGQLLEKTARANLAQAIDSEDEGARVLAANQLADAVAMQGRYEEAADLHTDVIRKKHFQDIGAALEMPDTVKCGCPDTQAKIDGVDIAITPRFERARIFSPLHNDIVSLITCRKCEHANARKAVSRLLPQQAALSESEALARVGRPLVLRDIQVLRKPDATA